jgi:hypothetical protein
MARVENKGQGLGLLISSINNARNMEELNNKPLKLLF